jgi:hypothetical protein
MAGEGTLGALVEELECATARIRIGPGLIAREEVGAWLSPRGELYAVPRWRHELVGKKLRDSGYGPPIDWNVSSRWVLIEHNGQLRSPLRINSAQWAALDAVAQAAREGPYKRHLCDAIATARQSATLLVSDPPLPPAAHVAARKAERNNPAFGVHPGD